VAVACAAAASSASVDLASKAKRPRRTQSRCCTRRLRRVPKQGGLDVRLWQAKLVEVARVAGRVLLNRCALCAGAQL